MKILEKFSRRTEIMGRMAQVLGVDFGGRVARDCTVAAQYRGAVMRCASCTHEAECLTWMSGQKTAQEAPEYCKNKDLLDSMSAG